MFSMLLIASLASLAVAEQTTEDFSKFAEISKKAKEGAAQYNPEWTPDGNEGGVNTNKLPWLDMSLEGVHFKPLRASRETGHFTIIIKVAKGFQFPKTVFLGASDMYVLSGNLSYPNGPMTGSLGPGYWGYTPANSIVEGCHAVEDTEYLATFYGAAGFLNSEGKLSSLFTSEDVRRISKEAGVHMLPLTLAEAMGDKKPAYEGAEGPLQCTVDGTVEKLNKIQEGFHTELTNPHFVNTNLSPWIVDEESGISLKVMRVSVETGFVSLMVRQNGQAAPHYHLGPADFFITSGHIGYRAGPPEGYGPGTYMWEPAGARHEATQRVTDEDLIYTANLYGPIQFDSGVGTPILLVFSWMQYLAAAQATGTPLLHSTFPNDHGTMLASSNIF